jgi:hypothetical protein
VGSRCRLPRKAAVQAVLSDIADLAGQYYERLHPGEKIGNPKLTVRQSGQGSVELATMFHGCEAPPLLHYSESHLDTLGLCFFLAIRKREAQKNPIFTLLMLDDVLHSVDADHRGRFAELLRDEFADHQLIITTHDPIFFTKLRQTLTGTFARLSINGWDIKRGPSPSDSSSDLDVVLAEDKTSMAPENLAAAAGRLCEWLLRTIAERLQVSIVARFETRHTIGDLWPPVAKKLRENKGFMAANPVLVDDLEKSHWVRNEVGAHYNDSPIPPTPGEVLEFAAALAMLYSATHCSNCRSATAKRSNDHWSCTCGSLRYGRRDTTLSEKITEPV